MYLDLIRLALKGKPSFKLQITVTAGSKTFTLPLISGETYNFTVNWGDGNVSTITAWDDADKTHTYASAGTYIISMWGTCTSFRFNNGGDKLKVNKILDVIDMGFTGDFGLDFYGCSNLTSVSSHMKRLKSLERVGSMFRDCTSLTSVPAGIFDGATEIVDASATFMGCSSLTSIPTDLFKYNTGVLAFMYTFRDCTSLTSIPTDLFRYNTAVTLFTDVFRNCTSLTSIPTDLFRYNTLVTNFQYAFGYNCSSLTSIPTDLFRYNTAVTNFGGVFRGAAITSIPTDLFRYNTAVTTFTQAFMFCASLATVPEELFRYNTLCTDFGSAFYGCDKLQQNDNIFWQDGARDTRFHDQSVDFGNCFRRTSFTGTQGTAPDLWNCDFGTGTPTKTDCWDGAGNSTTSLTNYDDIPVEWK